MDIELREILDKVYANEMKPDEAQWKICDLFNVSVTEGRLSPTNTAIQLLKVAKCPSCDGSGTVVASVDEYGNIDDIEPCQWCHEKKELVGDN